MTDCTLGKILFEELINKLCIIAYNYTDEKKTDIKYVGKVLRKSIK